MVAKIHERVCTDRHLGFVFSEGGIQFDDKNTKMTPPLDKNSRFSSLFMFFCLFSIFR